MLEPFHPFASRQQPQGQQLRYCLVRSPSARVLSTNIWSYIYRTNAYWVLLGIWWCRKLPKISSRYWLTAIYSYLPRAAPRSTFTQRWTLSNNWMETSLSRVIVRFDLLTLLRYGLHSINTRSFLTRLSTSLHSSFSRMYDPCVFYKYCILKCNFQGLNTTGTLISICQNDKFSFSFLENTYLGLAQAVTSTASTFGFWYIQRYWKISTKKMFVVTNVVTIMIPLWGMIGIWTNTIGWVF